MAYGCDDFGFGSGADYSYKKGKKKNKTKSNFTKKELLSVIKNILEEAKKHNSKN